VASLGAFVIHGNNAQTLEAALASLRPISDYLVTVDSGSTDGSADIAARYADRVELLPWQGYGAARARAWELVHRAGLEWTFALDSDERLPPDEAARLARLVRTGSLTGTGYRVGCRDLDLTGPRPYVFRLHHRVRLSRVATNPWSPRQLVHEAFPKGRYPRLDVTIEHHFLVDDAARAQKEHRYALLWALQHAGAARARPPSVAWLAHLTRDLLGRGALLRGGLTALRSARLLAGYSRLKYLYLAEVQAGRYAELVELYRRGALVELNGAVAALTGARAGATTGGHLAPLG
jgi:glycosyltransferase involved in cell wall biosynthesis